MVDLVNEPEVYLVSRPQLEWNELTRYFSVLDDRAKGANGASGWLHKVYSETGTDDGDVLVELGGRLCYRSWTPGMNANVTKVRTDSEEYLGNILKSGHGSVLEHANFSFIFDNVSRVFTHEMVRHRAGVAVSQESLRFVRLTDIPFWFPEWARSDPDLMNRSITLLHHMEEHQNWMAEHFDLDSGDVPFSEKKHKTSFMRRFAPEGVATGMLCTINVRALRHIIHMRTALAAEEEIRIVMDKVAELAVEAAPNLMQDYSRNENSEWVPEFLKI
ncbi:MAG: FAD-dependent thymidylate synthase [Hyphomicrobiaceae bacterium]|nr:MAG: FAD-dependent thymidylate synthase [Hyphomicrobiaceae bacterium]